MILGLEYLLPLFVLILLIYVMQIFILKKINIFLLITTIIFFVYNLTVILVSIFLKDSTIKAIIKISIFSDLAYLLYLTSLVFYLFNKKYNNPFILSNLYNQKENSFYLILNKKMKIKQISTSLALETNQEISYLKNKKIIDIFADFLKINKLNNEIITLEELVKKINSFKENFNGNINDTELSFYNYNGKLVILKFVIIPIISRNFFKGFAILGQKRTDFNLLGIEQKYNLLYDKYNLLQKRFVSLFSLVNQGIMTLDSDNNFWINDHLKDLLKFDKNNIDYNSYLDLIEPNDLKVYIDNMKKLDKNNLNLSLKYRIYHDNFYYWVFQKTNLIETDEKKIYMSIIEELDTNHFSKTNLTLLDKLKNDKQLICDMDDLIDNHKYFQLAIIKLSNLNEINLKFGRDVGNLCLNEYIYKIKSHFITESGDIYRLTGSTFAFLITDVRKFDLIKNGKKTNPKLMNMNFNYGSISYHLEVNCGVASLNNGAYNSKELFNSAKSSLDISLSDDYNSNIHIHGEMY